MRQLITIPSVRNLCDEAKNLQYKTVLSIVKGVDESHVWCSRNGVRASSENARETGARLRVLLGDHDGWARKFFTALDRGCGTMDAQVSVIWTEFLSFS